MIVSLMLAALLQTSGPTAAPEGTYRSRGYGWIIDRSATGFSLFHEAGAQCWPDPDGAEAMAPALAAAQPLSGGGVALSEAGDPDATRYLFDPLPALPAACSDAHTNPRAAVVAIADLMLQRYPGFEARGVDFALRRQAVLADLPANPSPEAAFAAAEALLRGLDDAHLELSAEIGGETRTLAVSEGATLDAVNRRGGERPERAWLNHWREGVEDEILGGRGEATANNRIFWGLRDGVGYLAILTMGGFDPEDDADTTALDAALDRAMAVFSGAETVVVDVSNNRGGYDAVSRRIGARFADRPRVAYLKRAWGSGAPAQAVEVRPWDGARYLGPVWLLTSDITVSAGETFSQMMRVLSNVTAAGAPTRGAFSDQTPVALANGWRFAMPMELYVDPDGKPLEGRGLPVEAPIDLYPAQDLDGGHARAVSALMDRLAR